MFPCKLYKEDGRLYIKPSKRLINELTWKCKEDFGNYLKTFYEERMVEGSRKEIYINLKEVVADFCKQNLEYDLLLEENIRLTSSGDTVDTIIVKELSRSAWFDKRGYLRITNSSTGL